ncbi:hypothetical protein FQA39_LY13876 [Lamprigera yunnana]|nr:hypothetical protein FQA39_LY13876 [Lamprigera yunnana]
MNLPSLYDSAEAGDTDSKNVNKVDVKIKKLIDELSGKHGTQKSKSVTCWDEDFFKKDYSVPLFCKTNPVQVSVIDLPSVRPIVENLSSSPWLSGGTLGSRTTVFVFKPSALAHPSDISIQTKPAYLLHAAYKIIRSETKLICRLLECHGMIEAKRNSVDFNLLWTGTNAKPSTLKNLLPHQRYNHFPRSYELTRKDRLYRNIEHMQRGKGFKNFDFVPQTFIMPGEYQELCTAHFKTKGPWIVKPVASSRGRGIFIIENPSQIHLKESVVVAKYIKNPLLVEGHKCDVRLYVLVSSFDPLIIYVYQEGLVRLATVKYDSSCKKLWNPCMHLCNYSINKFHSDYVKPNDTSAENMGHKWTLSALLHHLKSIGKDTDLLMHKIKDVVVKAILSTAGCIVPACKKFIPHFNNCFELYGFDILIDDNLKPWLLEANLAPSLGCDSPLDTRLKSTMIADLLTLVGIPAVDPLINPLTFLETPCIKNTNVNKLKMKLDSCRRIFSADASRSKNRGTTNKHKSEINLTSEDIKIIRNAKQQYNRRGGFVRVFPTPQSWLTYSQYLEPETGVPINGSPLSLYSFTSKHNYNEMLFTQLYPDGVMDDRKDRGRKKLRSAK